jgi:23S rRNA (uracil1939-C5)-methyltransferase
MVDTYNVRIDRLVYGGDGFGRLPDGKAVFVPFSLPGETVRLKLIEEKTRYVKAKIVEILESSNKRISARCSHFSQCGGCHYQHLNYADQLNAKKDILQEQLERIGGFGDIPPIEIIATPMPWNYRNHVQFHVTRDGKLGFQQAHSNQTFPIRECHLPEALINQLWPQIEIEPIPGLERISIRLGMDEDLLLILESLNDQGLDFSIENPAVSVVQTSPSGSLVLAGNNHLFMKVLEKLFRVSSGSFFQVNSFQANEMVKHLLANVRLDESMTVVDVYCGVGLFSAFLASKVKQLVGIEQSPEACEDFTYNLDEFERVSLYEAPADDVLSSINFNPDLIVMDPPREGMGVQTVAGIVSQGASNLVYISCDPATLARDAKRLALSGYKLMKIALFDLFPQTFHIETISYWEKYSIKTSKSSILPPARI